MCKRGRCFFVVAAVAGAPIRLRPGCAARMSTLTLATGTASPGGASGCSHGCSESARGGRAEPVGIGRSFTFAPERRRERSRLAHHIVFNEGFVPG